MGVPADDAALFAQLRGLWEEVDPLPADLVDRMVAAVASADLSREYALLTLVEGATTPVRSDNDTATLQFSDGTTSILLHVSDAGGDRRRIDGWTDAEAVEVHLIQGDRDAATTPGEHGRFAFEDVAPGLSRVRMVTRAGEEDREFLTPQFEV